MILNKVVNMLQSPDHNDVSLVSIIGASCWMPWIFDFLCYVDITNENISILNGIMGNDNNLVLIVND